MKSFHFSIISIVFIALLCGVNSNLGAQNSNLNWVRVIEETSIGSSAFQAIDTDEWGNVYLGGTYNGMVDLDPGDEQTNAAIDAQDCFIQKLDSDGNMIWVKTFGNSNFMNEIVDVVLYENRYVYVLGTVFGTVDIDPGAGKYEIEGANHNNMFLVKLDTEGNFIWATTIEADESAGSGLDIDAEGNVYVSGRFRGRAKFHPNGNYKMVYSKSNHIEDIYIEKISKEGELLWVKTLGEFNNTFSLAVDKNNGSVYICGDFLERKDFDPGPQEFYLSAIDDADAFVLKLDTNGHFEWAKSFGGLGWDIATDIKIDADGTVYSTGFFFKTLYYDSDELTDFSTDGDARWGIFVQKFMSDGQFLWSKELFGSVVGVSNELYLDSNGDVYITGFYNNLVDFDPGDGVCMLQSKGGADIFIEKFDKNGKMLWVESFGGAGFDQGSCMAVSNLGNLIVAGDFSNTVDFGKGLLSQEWDTGNTKAAFIMSLSAGDYGLTPVNNSFPNELSLYPNPIVDYYTVDLFKNYETINGTIVDLSGRIVERFTLKNRASIYREMSMPHGIYFLKIIADGKEAIFKIIKEKA